MVKCCSTLSTWSLLFAGSAHLLAMVTSLPALTEHTNTDRGTDDASDGQT